MIPIEITLNIAFECDRCENRVETEEVLGDAGRPDVRLFEARAQRDAEAGGWSFGLEGVLCHECSKEVAA